MNYFVTANYMTKSGNRGSAQFRIAATSHRDAFEKAADKIKSDKRRKYLGRLDLSISTSQPATREIMFSLIEKETRNDAQ